MVTPRATVLRASPATKPVRPLRAPLDRPSPSTGAFTALEVMLTMRPKPRAIMPSSEALISSMGASMLASRALIQSSRCHWRKSPGGGPPALVTTMSKSGWAAKMRARPSALATSAATHSARPGPRAFRRSAASRSGPSVRATMTTCTPSRTSAVAQARPRPELAPHTRALRPEIPRSMTQFSLIDAAPARTPSTRRAWRMAPASGRGPGHGRLVEAPVPALLGRVLQDAQTALLAPGAAHLHAAKRRADREQLVGVDPDGTGLQGLTQAPGCLVVARPDARGQAEHVVVALGHQVGLIAPGQQGQHGAEDLFLAHAGAVGQAFDHGGGVVAAAFEQGALGPHTPGQQLAPLVQAQLHIALDRGAVSLVDQGAHLGAFAGRVAHAQRLHAGQQAGLEFGIDAFMHKGPRAGNARLTRGAEDAYSTPATAWSRSASAHTMVGDFPPSSSEVGMSFSAARRAMPKPTVVPPVKAMRLIKGCLTRASPTIEPLPGSTLMMPSGTPACWAMRASSMAMRGVISAGLKTTAQPAARAGASFWASLAMGEFQGVMAPTTPSGSCALRVK